MGSAILTREPDHPDVTRLLRAYMTEIVSRWHCRPATHEEVDAALAEEPADDLVAPDGLLAVIEFNYEPAGIGGLRFIDEATAELTKVFTLPSFRGKGLASSMLDHLESVAAIRSCTEVRLDTRTDLIEACRLYEARGYERVAAFSLSPYSNRWYSKALAPTTPSVDSSASD